jgi:hypothetical protein
MSNSTLLQTAEKPITAATDDAIKSLTDRGRNRWATPLRRAKCIRSLPTSLDAPESLPTA